MLDDFAATAGLLAETDLLITVDTAAAHLAGAMGKLIKVGDQRAIQTHEGSINMVVANKYLVTIEGSADAEAKLAYAQAVDIAKLSKM